MPTKSGTSRKPAKRKAKSSKPPVYRPEIESTITDALVRGTRGFREQWTDICREAFQNMVPAARKTRWQRVKSWFRGLFR